MRLATRGVVLVCLLFMASPAFAQEIVAPNIAGRSVQGAEVNLADFRGDKNVLVVFYRLHS